MTFKCRFEGLVLPLFGEAEENWPNPIRLILYLMGLGWTFLGVAVISDVFMAGIEKVTSAKRRVKDKNTGRTITVHVWNATVANLTLMALGSSAPEILLSVIEILSDGFKLGPLGAGTIVGSAAFNLLCISAVCVLAIDDKEVRYIKQVPVYVVTSSFSVFAYLWLMFVLMVTSPDVCELWEAVVTLLFCPLLVLLAFVADRGYFSQKPADGEQEASTPQQTIPDDVTEAELAAIEQEIRDQHGATLTSDQVVKIMQAVYFSSRSRAYYRRAAFEAQLKGKKTEMKSQAPPDLCISEAIGTTDDIANELSRKTVEIGFASDRYAFAENCRHAKLVLVRSGPSHCQASVDYITREGTAKAKSDYTHCQGTIVFEKGETEKTLLVEIKDDVAFEEEEEFYVDLSAPKCEDTSSCQAKLSPVAVATVVIIDDDLPGGLRFKVEEMEVVEGMEEQTIEVTVDRYNGSTGTISCSYHTDNGPAVSGIDFSSSKGTLEFAHNVQFMTIPIVIKPRGHVKSVHFFVVLTDAKGCKFDDKADGSEDECICCVHIKGRTGETRMSLFKDMKARVVSANAIMGQRHWGEQFKDALFQIGDDDGGDEEDGGGGPSKLDYFIHFISIPWKLLFAFVPPPDYCGGWACFGGALCMIAVVTAIVGDMANLVGCCFDILPETAAITFVALGTSLPDTFASKAAAVMDPYADASIGNITGSNSINVFMGIGLAWCLAAFRWETDVIDDDWRRQFDYLTPDQQHNVRDVMKHKDGNAVFVTPAGTIWFNLMVFSVNAFFALQHLFARRKRFGGELGGPKKGVMGQYFSAAFLVAQWFIYITASVIFARVGDSALTYGQIADKALRADAVPKFSNSRYP